MYLLRIKGDMIMDKKGLVQVVKEMIAAPSCYKDLQKIGQEWVDAVGTDKEKAAAKKLLAEVKADINTVDDLIEFAASSEAVKIFGEKGAEDLEAHGKQIKAEGATYCDCGACAGAEKILKNESVLLS